MIFANQNFYRVNDVDVSGASHDEAVRAMNEPGDIVELSVVRKENLNTSVVVSYIRTVIIQCLFSQHFSNSFSSL